MTRAAYNRYHRKYHRARTRRMNEVGLTSRGKPLKHRLYPQLARFHGKERKRLRQRMNRAELKAKGLTIRGTPPVVRCHPELRGLDRRTSHRLRMRKYYAERIALGLTARGTERILGVMRLTPVEAKWREFRNCLTAETQKF